MAEHYRVYDLGNIVSEDVVGQSVPDILHWFLKRKRSVKVLELKLRSPVSQCWMKSELWKWSWSRKLNFRAVSHSDVRYGSQSQAGLCVRVWKVSRWWGTQKSHVIAPCAVCCVQQQLCVYVKNNNNITVGQSSVYVPVKISCIPHFKNTFTICIQLFLIIFYSVQYECTSWNQIFFSF